MTDRDTISFPPADEDGVDTNGSVESVMTSEEKSSSGAARDVLTAIADPDCQTILAASAEQSLTVADVVEQCEIPTATAYRKVNILVDAGLLHEQIQIRPYGRNEREYTLRIDTIHVSFTDSGIPTARVTLADDGPNQASTHALTDGGRTAHDEGESCDSRHLGSIFVDITGSEKLVDEQETDRQSRQLTDAGEHSVSEYVSEVTRDDGLSDSLPEPDGPTQE